ncbi:MAG: aminotransferase [Phenylobacterium zucineum]|nr:MAG: aminotransferase [Phenylobacterium zucineum]
MIERRAFLGAAGLAAAATSAGAQSPSPAPDAYPPPGVFGPKDWGRVRQMFDLAPDRVDMSAMLISSHPRPVREAIDRHRRELDRTPIEYLERNNRPLQNAARGRVGRYLGVPAANVALTDSTTMGAGLVYNGLQLGYGQEALTTDRDYYVTHEALRLSARRNGATVRRIPLYADSRKASAEALTNGVVSQIRPNTRLLALTWVHSSTGLKMPIGRITAEVARINQARAAADRVIVSVDGVHGFGCEDAGLPELGCDIFFAGAHKWLFGPRGTGVVAASAAGLAALRPTIPTFLDSMAYSNWITGADPGANTGARFTPGGFKAFEHLWALSDAFVLHDMVGRRQVAQRTGELTEQLKAGLAAMPHVTLWTPRSRELSAGIVSFDVAGLSADQAVDKLRGWKIMASAAPYARPHVRLTPSIRNSPEEVDFALKAVRDLA